MTFDQVPEREETLSRFIFSRSHFSPVGNRVKPHALLPHKDTLETSVFRTAGLERAEIRRIGDMAGAPKGHTLKAWGDIFAGAVFDVGLDVRPDNVPERHAAIVGWPEEKDRQISLAQQLAAAATLNILS